MGTDSIFKGCYIVTSHNAYEPYGRMVASYSSEDEALAHIKFQKSIGSNSYWNILHIKDMQWLNPAIGKPTKE